MDFMSGTVPRIPKIGGDVDILRPVMYIGHKKERT